MITIDNRALVNNANFFAEKLGRAKLCAVLKCDAYSHGLVTCATILADSVNMIALSTVAEADSIRHIGVPILILLPLDDRDTASAVNSGYIMTVDSIESAMRVSQYGSNSVVHIKVDSGMCRLGGTADNLLDIVDILHDAGVDIYGIYSHCAMASNSSYTTQQYLYFSHCCNKVACRIGYMPTRHFANTDGVLASSMYHMDMARVGLGLYGYGHSSLQRVKKVYGKVLSVKAVSKGSKVGYDNTYIMPHNSYIAVVDIGYWHGISQWIDSVVVGNAPCKVVGRACMGMIMVDIGTNVVKQFDLVTIIGDNISIKKNSTTSIYEILCATKDTTR